MRLEDVRKSHAQQLAADIKLQVSEATGQCLSEKTCANIIGVLGTMFQSAVDRDILQSNPFKLPRGTFQRAPTKRRTTYQIADVRKLMADPAVHLSAKVFAALAFYTGEREGEIGGRRWRDLDMDAKPLGCLTVASQYNDRPLKTEKRAGTRPRFVPVHPELARVLAAWWSTGWELVHLRPPCPDDFIVPAKGIVGHTKSSAYKMWRKACLAAGVQNVSLHSTRHTFMSLARRGGARKEVVEKVTHNAAGDIVDSYTHWDWAPFCEAVLCVQMGDSPSVELVTGMLTSVQTKAILPVEAPGIESGRLVETSGHSEDATGNDATTRTATITGNCRPRGCRMRRRDGSGLGKGGGSRCFLCAAGLHDDLNQTSGAARSAATRCQAGGSPRGPVSSEGAGPHRVILQPAEAPNEPALDERQASPLVRRASVCCEEHASTPLSGPTLLPVQVPGETGALPRRPAPWVHEAVANLYELLAGGGK